MHACRVGARTASSSAGESTSSTTTYPSRRNLAARAASSRGREAPASSRDIPSEPRPEPPRGTVIRRRVHCVEHFLKSRRAAEVNNRVCGSCRRALLSLAGATTHNVYTHIVTSTNKPARRIDARSPRAIGPPSIRPSSSSGWFLERIANTNPRRDPSPGGTSPGRRLVAPSSRVFLFRLVSIRFSTWRPRRARPSSRQPCPRRRRRRACRPRHPSSCRARRDRPGRLGRTPCVGARPGRARRRGR